MTGDRFIDVELLEDDWHEIQSVPSSPDDGTLEDRFRRALDLIEEDDARWRDLQHDHSADAERATQRLRWREMAALVVALRPRTIRLERREQRLREQVQLLHSAHADAAARMDEARRTIADLLGRIHALEAALHGRRPASRPRAFIRSAGGLLLRKRHG
jgi:chromosome segregation ATPase